MSFVSRDDLADDMAAKYDFTPEQHARVDAFNHKREAENERDWQLERPSLLRRP